MAVSYGLAARPSIYSYLPVPFGIPLLSPAVASRGTSFGLFTCKLYKRAWPTWKRWRLDEHGKAYDPQDLDARVLASNVRKHADLLEKAKGKQKLDLSSALVGAVSLAASVGLLFMFRNELDMPTFLPLLLLLVGQNMVFIGRLNAKGRRIDALIELLEKQGVLNPSPGSR